jgi:hypothetical protein
MMIFTKVKSLRKSSSEQGRNYSLAVMGELDDKMANSCLHDLLLQRQATLEIYKVLIQ